MKDGGKGETVREGREEEGETNKRNFLADPGVIRLAYSSLCAYPYAHADA